MKKHIEELRKKLIDLKTMAFGFFNSSYGGINFKIFLKDFGEIFSDYEFPDRSYKNSFNEVNLMKINKMVEGNFDGKKQFKNNVEKYQKLLDRMILDIDKFGWKYGDKFIKVKKKSSDYSKEIGFEKKI